MAIRHRKRSATVRLVLAGGFSSVAGLTGCGEPLPQQDAYRNLGDCVRDWGNASQCEPVRDNQYARSYYYGPAYFGGRYSDGRPKPSPNAMDVVDRPKGTRVGSATARTGTSNAYIAHGSSGSRTTSRSGFGSSARSSGG